MDQRILGEGGGQWGGGAAAGQWGLVFRVGETPLDPTGECVGSLQSQRPAPE